MYTRTFFWPIFLTFLCYFFLASRVWMAWLTWSTFYIFEDSVREMPDAHSCRLLKNTKDGSFLVQKLNEESIKLDPRITVRQGKTFLLRHYSRDTVILYIMTRSYRKPQKSIRKYFSTHLTISFVSYNNCRFLLLFV